MEFEDLAAQDIPEKFHREDLEKAAERFKEYANSQIFNEYAYLWKKILQELLSDIFGMPPKSEDTVLEEAMGKSLGLPAHPDPDAFTTRHPVEDVKGVDVKPHPGAFNSFGFYGNTMGKLINWCFLVRVSEEFKRMREANEYHSPGEEKMKSCAEAISEIKRSIQLLSSILGQTTHGTSDPQPGGSSVPNLGHICYYGYVLTSTSTSSHRWIVDSGATHHVSGSQPLFKALHPFDHKVTLANGSSAPITGIGLVRLSDNLTLKDVLYAEGFPYNLISVSALIQQHHYTVIFISDYYVILDLIRCQMIGMGRQSGNLYMLDSSNLFSFPP